jgi:hypothetical protein
MKTSVSDDKDKNTTRITINSSEVYVTYFSKLDKNEISVSMFTFHTLETHKNGFRNIETLRGTIILKLYDSKQLKSKTTISNEATDSGIYIYI